MHDFAEWSNFYVIVGSSAAALTGLLFIVITLVAGDRTRTTNEGISTYTTPTIVHFCAALFVAAVVCAPWHAALGPAIAIGVVGLFGTAYVAYIIYRQTRQTAYDPDIDDWIFFSILPLLCYVTLATGALLLAASTREALFVVGAAVLLLILLGIRNAWDVVTYIAFGRAGQDRKEAGTSTPPGAAEK
jgi:small-conductance mechanosensitive channel